MSEALQDRLSENMAERLTKPLLDGWHVVTPHDVLIRPCDTCGTRAVFVRIQANDCDVWGMRGIDGASSSAYGLWCHLHG